ncbi:MAG: c-type cytochrome biogenesis protein CcsB [Microbacteriaceae bacterium]|nr:c-type cytochrome biogenesis protein CcsB [Microbacteriaceae bacterium]
MSQEILVDLSNLAFYSALAVYTVSFIAFTLDLGARAEGRGGKGAQAVGISVAWLGFALHVTAAIARGLAAGRVPWANMFEFALTATMMIMGVFLVLIAFKGDLRYLGTFIIGLVILLLGLAVFVYVPVTPLDVSLQDIWLVIHVLVATLSVGFFAIGFALSVLQLFQSKSEKVAVADRKRFDRVMATLPEAKRLEQLAYRITIVGFVFWTFTLIAGAIWAYKAWGRYWGWDTKEVWTFIIWVFYAGYIHARATKGWQGKPAAWLCIIAFLTVVFNFTIVNTMFQGLHSYSGL